MPQHKSVDTKNLRKLFNGGPRADPTPLIFNKSLASRLGLPRLYLKDEGENPSGSFKDRGSLAAFALHAAQLLQEGKETDNLTVGTVSTGNMAISTAMLGRILGLRNFVVLKNNPGHKKMKAIESVADPAKTTLFLVDGDYARFHEKVYRACRNLREKGQPVFAELTNDAFRTSGYTTIFTELLEQCSLRGGAPGAVLVPGASGALFCSAVATLERFKGLGAMEKVPRVFLVQEEGGDAIVQAWEKGASRVSPIKLKKGLVASAINVSHARSGNAVLGILKKGYHGCLSVTTEEIKEAQKLLFDQGIFAEEAAAASLAAAKRLRDGGRIQSKDSVVCLLTGRDIKKRMLGQPVNDVDRVYCKISNLQEALEGKLP